MLKEQLKWCERVQVDLQPAAGGALAGAATEAAVGAVAADLAARMPGAFDLHRVRAAAQAHSQSAAGLYAAAACARDGKEVLGNGADGSGGHDGGGLSPTWVVLLQEVERWNTARTQRPDAACPALPVEPRSQDPCCCLSLGTGGDRAHAGHPCSYPVLLQHWAPRCMSCDTHSRAQHACMLVAGL